MVSSNPARNSSSHCFSYFKQRSLDEKSALLHCMFQRHASQAASNRFTRFRFKWPKAQRFQPQAEVPSLLDLMCRARGLKSQQAAWQASNSLPKMMSRAVIAEQSS